MGLGQRTDYDSTLSDKAISAAIKGTCIARDLINEPLSHLNAEQLSRIVKKLAKEAGFILSGRSDINANIKDTKDHPAGVWSLPPTLYLKDKDKEKYIEIGETDRMTLLFRKPL